MIKIAICDDDNTMRDYITRVTEVHFKDYSDGIGIFSYSDGGLLLSDNMKDRFDVLFLDIQMPNIDGFEIAREIRRQSKDTYVIFITSNDSLMSDAFDYQPFHFICKRDRGSIERDIKRVLSSLVEHIKRYSTISVNLTVLESRSITVSELLFIEVDGHYLKYHLNGGEALRVRGEMQAVCDTMDTYHFIRVHRSYLVNPLHINRMSMQNDRVTLSSGRMLEIGRSFKKDAAKRFGGFCSRGSIL